MKKLTDEVSLQELQQMRAEGLTNKQIAERLDTTSNTILKYLGPQPEGLRAPYGAYTTRVTEAEPVKAPTAGRSLSVKTEYTRTWYAGEAYEYMVESTGAVEIRQWDGEHVLRVGASQFDVMLKELLDIAWMLKEGATC